MTRADYWVRPAAPGPRAVEPAAPEPHRGQGPFREAVTFLRPRLISRITDHKNHGEQSRLPPVERAYERREGFRGTESYAVGAEQWRWMLC